MAKKEERFTQVPNILLDDNSLNVYEFRILMHIARKTMGFHKKSDGISLSWFVKDTGMSKATVVRTIDELKKKKLIKIVKQTAPSGGKSFNRYSLTLVSERHHLVSDRDNPSITETLPLVSDRDIQKKIEQNKIDKRRETEKNVFFFLSDHERTRETRAYTDSISFGASNPEAYKVKILKQIDKEHKQTLEAFEEWYLATSCQRLNTKYAGKGFGRYTADSFYSYTDTTGYVDQEDYQKDFNLYVKLVDDAGKQQIHGAYTASGMKELVESL